MSVIIFSCDYCLAGLSSGLNLKNTTKASNMDATYRSHWKVVVDHAGSLSSSKGVQSEAERTIYIFLQIEFANCILFFYE